MGTRKSLVRGYGGSLRAPTAHHNGDGWSNLLATAKGEIAPSQATASGGVGSLKARTETTSGKYQHI